MLKMKKLDVTVFHKTVEGRKISFVPKVYQAKRYSVRLSANSNISQKGFVPNSNVVLRFSSRCGLPISVGDRVALKITENLCDTTLSVRSVSQNNIGSRFISHTKVVCS